MDTNIKTLVISVVRPYMTGLKMYYSELYNKVLAKLAQHDDDLAAVGASQLELTEEQLTIQQKYLEALLQLNTCNEKIDYFTELIAKKRCEECTCGEYLNQLDALRGYWDEKYTQLQEDITQLQQSLAQHDERITALEVDNTSMKEQMTEVLNRLTVMESRIDSAETDIDILQLLPDVNGVHIYRTDEIANILETYRPPTIRDIFDTWARIGNDNGYYPPGTTPEGEAAQWFWENNKAVCKSNTAYVTGFISTEEMVDYDSDVVMSGESLAEGRVTEDDDYLVFIMAFKRIDNINHILALTVDRQPGVAGVRVVYGTRSVISPEAIPPNTVSAGTGTQIAKHSVTMSSGAWGLDNYIRLRTVRRGDIFTIYVSSISKDPTPDLHETPLIVDVSKYSSLDWLRGPIQYGYGCQSQEATFSNIIFKSTSNDKETVYNADTGDVWRWSGAVWTLDTDVKAWDVLGYPRNISSVDDHEYFVDKDSITLRSEES